MDPRPTRAGRTIAVITTLLGLSLVEVIDAWDCPSSGVAANSWSVCFGETFLHGTIFAEGYARGVDLGQTGDL